MRIFNRLAPCPSTFKILSNFDTQTTFIAYHLHLSTHSLCHLKNCPSKICRIKPISISYSCLLFFFIIRHFANTIIFLVYFCLLWMLRRLKVIYWAEKWTTFYGSLFVISHYKMISCCFMFVFLLCLCVCVLCCNNIYIFVRFSRWNDLGLFSRFYYYLHDQYAYRECLEISWFLTRMKDDRKANLYSFFTIFSSFAC